MKDWNPFGKVDTEIGSFLKESVFNKEYSIERDERNEDNEAIQSNENNEYIENNQNTKKQ
jgi:hypothetical protein